ncbi:MAG: bifunctional folylpolyglutamate synthase/dihydrofolate synthase [Micavibrio aeruginosavorus]|uniref:tetrahydrofolate synthase n=1 Tax=Micavibrio aeruginosavorus TaxID=349221 RepID=A0A2W5FSQ3_9BACT|nr:MAG: bifunctional folylpolyglutamate synthase/dihydrofolate synthase [Micavibrio aeruginosavorus]
MPEDILDRLTRLYPKAIEPGLERTCRILHDIGDPHLKLPPVIHIAGTNGKGSTLAFIRSLLEDHGKTCHVMTSPHLVKFNERLVISGEEISDAELEKLLLRVEALNAGKPVTFFEITTAAGMLAFAENPADYTLLETGMGGRLDSTNVIEHPLVTIITNISLDHMQHLGDSLAKIAFEKAGIMKSGVPCIIGPGNESVMDVFESRAAELNAPLYRYGREWDYEITDRGFTLTINGQDYECPKPNLLGDHQYANAATAIMSLLSLSFLRKQESPFHGITKALWPARLQKLNSGKLFDLLPKGWELWLDGGHNEAGGKILGHQARHWQEEDGTPLHLILGMLTTKDPAPFFDHLKPYITSATAIPIPDEKLAFSALDLADRLSIHSAPAPDAAITDIVKTAPSGRILITGSLYLAGSILKS